MPRLSRPVGETRSSTLAVAKRSLILYADLRVLGDTAVSCIAFDSQAKGISMETVPRPKHFRPGEGMTYELGRMSMTFKTTATDGWNAYTVCEAIEPRGCPMQHYNYVPQ